MGGDCSAHLAGEVENRKGQGEEAALENEQLAQPGQLLRRQ